MISHGAALGLARRFDTPFYVYDLDDVAARCHELRGVLPPGALLYYSLKANPLPVVAAAARQAGARVEVSSEGELAAARAAGFDPSAILYTGPAKNERELAHAFASGVGAFSAESFRDLAKISAAAEHAGTIPRVLLRINPPKSIRAGLAMTGVPSQFGFDEDEIASSLLPERYPRIQFAGLHVYLGTQVPASELAASFRIGFAVAARLVPLVPLRFLDLGGGFPWPFATTDPPPDLLPLAFSLAGFEAARDLAGGAELWFESGRYLAASCGTLVARVLDVKRSQGTLFVILDAGVAHLGGMSGLGRLFPPAVSLVSLRAVQRGEPLVADVVGPLCTPLDCLGRAVLVPAVEPGDLVAIANVGAYGATASLTAFLSRPAALEISLRGGRIVDVARLSARHEPVDRTFPLRRAAPGADDEREDDVVSIEVPGSAP
jgi:diaminopimelate decarboxylase